MLIVAPRHIRSMNARSNKENAVRIANENHKMLNRLIVGKSTFSVNNWERQFQKRRRHLDSLGQYPYILTSGSRGASGAMTSLDIGAAYQSLATGW